MFEGIFNRLGYSRTAELDALVDEFNSEVALVRSFIGHPNFESVYHQNNATLGWKPSATPYYKLPRDEMIARSRDLISSTPIARNCSEVLSHNVIGHGVRPVPNTDDKEFNAEVERLFTEEFVPNCDFYNRGINYYSLQDALMRQIFATGDAFLIRRGADENGYLKLQIFTAEQLDESKRGDNIVEGIEYDALGRRIAYHFFPNNPKDSKLGVYYNVTTESVRIPAEDVIHAYELGDSNLSRGLPWTLQSMDLIYQLAQVTKAEVQRKNIEATLALFVKHGANSDGSGSNILSNKNKTNQLTDSRGNVVHRISGNGAFVNVPYGSDIHTATVASTGGVSEWFTVMLTNVAAGMRIPYILASGDLSKTNFSSSRLGMQEFHKLVNNVQNNIIKPTICQRVYEWFIEQAVANGDIRVFDTKVRWVFPKREAIEPVKDLTADIMALNAGLITHTDLLNARGLSFDDTMIRIQEEKQRQEELGLTFGEIQVSLADLSDDEDQEGEEEEENEEDEADEAQEEENQAEEEENDGQQATG